MLLYLLLSDFNLHIMFNPIIVAIERLKNQKWMRCMRHVQL